MSEAVTVELRMIEQVFRLATTVEKKPDLEKAAELLNEKFQEFRRNAPLAWFYDRFASNKSAQK